MITKYYAYGRWIKTQEVIRETEKSVFFAHGDHCPKLGGWYIYTDSFDEAKQFLLRTTANQIKAVSDELAQLQLKYQEINDIQRF